MKVTVVEKGNVRVDEGPCVVLTSFEEDGAPDGNLIVEDDRAALKTLTEQGRISSKAQSQYFLPTPTRPYAGILALGLGNKDRFEAEVFRRAPSR